MATTIAHCAWSSIPIVETLILVAKVSDFEGLVTEAVLNKAEKKRQLRFKKTEDRQRYCVAHAIKRHVLSQYIGEAAIMLSFDEGRYGKPYCNHPSSPFFNISHSEDWAAFIVSQVADVGIDIQSPRRVSQERILRRIGSPNQIKDYLASDDKDESFFNLWTQKEAVSKAHGQGLSIGFSAIETSALLSDQEIDVMGEYYHVNTVKYHQMSLSYASKAKMSSTVCRLYPPELL